MHRFDSYLSEAISLIEAYKGKVPFSIYIKGYFSKNKKFGSTDRKTIIKFCYYFFRVGFAVSSSKREAMISGFFLCEEKESKILEYLNPFFNQNITRNLNDKLELLKITLESIFPLVSSISEEVDKDKFALSFLKQPELFLRVRPGKKQYVIEKLKDADVKFNAEEDWIRLENSEKIDKIISLNVDAVVQDVNSQKVFNFFKKSDLKREYNVWDCCAASGGKSILLYDRLKGRVRITASDVRLSILENYKSRLQKAKINFKNIIVADLTKPLLFNEKFDIIICDAPCTGSGTWSRTPEQLFLSNKESITQYSVLQKQIIDNSITALKPGGYYCYITCSVFFEENEANSKYISEKFKVEKLFSEYLKGYENKADTLFVSIFKLVS